MESGGGFVLISFSIENLFSYADEAVLSMEATPIKAHSYSLIERNNKKLLPLAVIYGANASGKTNLVEGMTIFLEILSGSDKWDFFPFLMNKGKKLEDYGCSKVKMEFMLGDKEYMYEVHFKINEIKKESLSFRGINHEKYYLIYERSFDVAWTLVTRSSGYAKTLLDEIKYVNGMETKPTHLLLTSLMRRGERECFKNMYDWLDKTIEFDGAMIPASHGRPIIFQDDVKYRFLQNDKKIKKYMNFVRQANPMISGMKLREREEENKRGKKGFLIDLEYPLSDKGPILNYFESTGTQKAVIVYPHIYEILQSGGMLIVDELENSLHPLLMIEIINMFSDPDVNVGGGQLIFTTHNVIIMDNRFFRQDEIWFTEKDADGKSTLFSLADFNIRSDLDFCKHYIMGRFGAVPQFDTQTEGSYGEED